MPETLSTGIEKVILAAPRGYCAGVDRAVQTVERALDNHGAPIYVRKEIVHNKHVVEQLAARGAIFVEEETEVPEGEIVVPNAETCAGCHKKDNPEHKADFDFETAVKKIAHPIPSE